MGLENNMVEGTTTNYDLQGTKDNVTAANNLNGGDPTWLAESYVTYTAGKTLVKIGRQELDTPLAYSKKWNSVPNTFEAAVVINQSIENLVLIGAYVGNGNGEVGGNTVRANGDFVGYWGNTAGGSGTGIADDEGGAYAAAAVFSGIADTPIKAFYYSLPDTADAYWADVHGKVAMVNYGVIIAGVSESGATKDYLDSLNVDTGTTTAIAAKVSTTVAGANIYAAFSSVSEGNLPVANTATGFKKTKLPTAGIFTDGNYVAVPDTVAYKVGASYKIAGVDLAAAYVSSTTGENKDHANAAGTTAAHNGTDDLTTSEFNVVVKTTLDQLNLAAMYINQADYKYNATSDKEDNRNIVRVIASVNF
jgi:hypothetical protein